MDLDTLRTANVARQEEWCPDQKPDLSFRGNELAGEVGETIEALQLYAAELGKQAGIVCNLVKKLERERHGWIGSRAALAQLEDEVADLVICADLTLLSAGSGSLSGPVGRKFNATSEKNGLRTRIDTV